jgi:AcrR family transcriptional regulator
MFDYLLRCSAGVNNQSRGSVRNGTEPRKVFGNGGAMEAGTTDRRVRRTRELLRGALLSLIQEKGYDRITVQDIIDRADVGRSTFYAHYRDKDELLRSGFEDIHAALVAEMDASAASAKGAFLQPMIVLFEHVGRHRHLWSSLTRKGGADLITRIVRTSADELVRAHFRVQLPDLDPGTARYEFAAAFVVGALMGVLVSWLDSDSQATAQEVHGEFRRLATRGVRRALPS